MNRKVFVSMLVLTIIFLVGLYVAKIFFPQEFVMAVENENIVKIGNFIDGHQWLYDICCGATAFVTYFLYCCAVCRKKFLNWKECITIFGVIVLLNGISYLNMSLYTVLSTTSFFFIPAIMKGNLKSCAIVFTTHSVAQVLSLQIRSFELFFTNQVNFVTGIFMTAECYFWLLLFYIIYNYEIEKGDLTMGKMCPPWYGKSDFYEKKKAKALKIIEKQKAIIDECDEQLANLENDDK